MYGDEREFPLQLCPSLCMTFGAVYVGINTSNLSNINVFIHFTCNFNQRHYHFNHKSRHTPSSESTCWSDDCRWWSFCFTLDLVGESFTTLNMDCDNPVSSSTPRRASAVLAFNSWTTKQTDNKVSVSCQLPRKLWTKESLFCSLSESSQNKSASHNYFWIWKVIYTTKHSQYNKVT